MDAMKKRVIEAIARYKLIAVIRGISEDEILGIAQALYQGGIRLAEVAFDAAGNTPDIITASMIRRVRERFGAEFFVGAGTVLTPEQVQCAKAGGAEYVISPDVNPEVIRATAAAGMVSIPGALTPSEMQLAHRCGADFVKACPAGNLGSDYIRAVRSPLSHIRLLAVGGIHKENLGEYLHAGACGIAINSNIIKKELVAKKDYAAISALAQEFVQAVEACC